MIYFLLVYLVLQLETVLGLGDQASDHLEADDPWGVLIEYLQETSKSCVDNHLRGLKIYKHILLFLLLAERGFYSHIDFSLQFSFF